MDGRAAVFVEVSGVGLTENASFEEKFMEVRAVDI